MGKIYLLDEVTANQIAAGEVIERPASVVKELIENALDARADNLSVDLKDGGTTSIKISDNGIGMTAEDAEKAFQRHATSKIKSIHDLERLVTLGFRGEALASIASVARVELITKTSEELCGTKVLFEGGKLIRKEEIGAPNGTTIVVENLFFNTPARKKNLKSNQRELALVNELIHKLSLANPSVGFSLSNNAKLIFTAPKGLELKQRLFDVYGADIAKEMLRFNAANDLFKITGYVGKATISRNSRSHQAIFINNRYVKSSLISRAVEEGYHTYLMVNRYPIFVLHISVNPDLVDVNVHPTKMEVRFDHEQMLQDLITNEVQKTLGHKEVWVEPKINVFQKEKVEQVTLKFNKEENSRKDYRDLQQNNTPIGLDLKKFLVKEEKRQETSQNKKIYQFEDSNSNFPQLTPLGQINASFIVCQGEDGLYLIDQHAAHERVLYEKLMSKEKEKIDSQQMLIPTTLELTGGYSQLLIENIVLFSNLGFIIEHFGGDTFIIRGVPSSLQEFNEKELLIDLLDDLKSNHGLDVTKVKEKMIVQMSCKGAIKAGEALEPEEIDNLLTLLGQQANPYTCPHGRPTLVHFSGYELDKMFKRIV